MSIAATEELPVRLIGDPGILSGHQVLADACFVKHDYEMMVACCKV